MRYSEGRISGWLASQASFSVQYCWYITSIRPGHIGRVLGSTVDPGAGSAVDPGAGSTVDLEVGSAVDPGVPSAVDSRID
jgi:hypothetical protein